MTSRAKSRAFRLLPVLLLIAAVTVSWLVLHEQKNDTSKDETVSAASGGAWSGPSTQANSNEERFMDDLAARAVTVRSKDRAGAAQPKVFWKSGKGLVKTAQGILERYEQVDTAALSTSGYLDLQGNVWGAIVSDSRGWVDMCTVIAGESDEACEVRAVRLLPKEE